LPEYALILATGIVWLVFLADGPILLVLIPFGWNFTGIWVLAGAWLLVVTLSLVGIYFLSAWIRPLIQGEKSNNIWLLVGVSILVLFISATLLMLLRDTIPAPLAVGLAALVSLSFFGLYLSAVMAKVLTHPIRHIVMVAYILIFGVSIISNTILLRHEELHITQEVYNQLQVFDNPTLRVIMNIILFASTAINLRKNPKETK
jgi:hypothetical protein